MTLQPSPAERARTILAHSTSAEVVGGPDEPGGWAMRTLTLSRCTADQEPGQPVEVEVADAAPLPVRDRIRGRVLVSGTTHAATGCDALHVQAAGVTLLVEDGRHDIDVQELLDADPDPLAEVEAAMLAHLDATHADVLETLTLLVDPRHRLGVVRVWPYRLDRHGLVLRLERASGHVDRRLPFRRPLADPRELSGEMAALIARGHLRAAGCRHARGAGVGPLLRATAAADRLCSPQPDDPQT